MTTQSIEAATERVVTLMTPAEKARLEARASRAGVSVGEFVRRSVDSYDPETETEVDLAVLRSLSDDLRRSNLEALDALDAALASLRATREQLGRP